MGVSTGYEGQLKLTHINLAVLNIHVTVTYLRFIKNTYFYAVKEKKCVWSCVVTGMRIVNVAENRIHLDILESNLDMILESGF